MSRRPGAYAPVERDLDIGEVTIRYAEGPPGGPPLLLIPGQGMSHDTYSRVLPLLTGRFHVMAMDVRGHGGSTWTPGRYDFDAMGSDAAALLEERAGGPALVSGSSSGGLIALWLAANRPELVSALVMEDAPLFSAEWPRLREDCYVYRVFGRAVECLTGPVRDLPGFLASVGMPSRRSGRVHSVPRWLMAPLGWPRAARRPGQPVDLPLLPPAMRIMVRSLTSYDPEFSRAFLDGSACRGLDHSEALSLVRCQAMYLHADWFRTRGEGLLAGAADDRDVERMRRLLPAVRYRRMRSKHLIHLHRPADYAAELTGFADDVLPAGREADLRKERKEGKDDHKEPG